MLIPVLLSGGVGSRLWPLSRELNPKQFLPLAGSLSLLEQTMERTKSLDAGAPIIVCNDEHRFTVAEQMRGIGTNPDAIILEPMGKNTAPAVAVAALQAIKQSPEGVMLVMPADHVVRDVPAFSAAVAAGMTEAQQGRLVTFGIVPESPETGYGYIRRNAEVSPGNYAIAEFVEKPSLEIAQQYVDSGDYYWNSGMFLMGAQTYLDELQVLAPAMLSAAKAAFDAANDDLDFVRLGAEEFSRCPSDSIDYAVMEKTEQGVVVPLSCGWSDVGAWSSLWEVGDKDTSGNVMVGDTLLHNTENSYVHSNSRLVTTVGVDNIVVVETPDAVLVADKDQVQDVKAIVNSLKAADRTEATAHTKVYRPWGSYESLAIAERFQVKRIVVNPGQKLSLQLHHHRAEHWIVVSGTAVVTCGDKEFVLSEDQSTYIPLGTKHRLANTGVIPLELIEVQSGSYLGEDDIVRFEDVYGRSN
ncbi:mannose-1-phosphate guanylyltransferase/mannose-6-phosphate isomerase [Oceanicoccus sagamiensis]|uniref:mannose-1-phosphate guanylyltransferase n=1 Tax=Oceanicoccus sagamiensis TaxID=716816 RepID=A0A1X9N8W4_9GAMM|nr:mannose-1-phosphate guanylyltransferase/mannose-6-phosphate isomerase [Oceanicoccus sagamiensis]ARN74500.1 mannose-1-phosphate guanylyltransferase/mannose-6-phosphate isomerase [Oceanicoccus sagamiensis]